MTSGELFSVRPQSITVYCLEEFSVASFITGYYQGSHYSQVLSKDSELKMHAYLFASCSDFLTCEPSKPYQLHSLHDGDDVTKNLSITVGVNWILIPGAHF